MKTNITVTIIRIQSVRDQLKAAEFALTNALTNSAILLDTVQSERIGQAIEHTASVGLWMQTWQAQLEEQLTD